MQPDLDRLFRIEANELTEALAKGLLELEKDGTRVDLIAHCYRLAHTLKGAARTVRRTDLSELAHTMEEALAPYRQSGDPVEADCASDLLKLLEAIRADLSQGPPGARADLEVRSATGPEQFETVRIELSDMDALLASLTEARAQLRGLRDLKERVTRSQRAIGDLLALVEGDLDLPRGVIESYHLANRRQIARGAIDDLRDTLLHLQHDVLTRLGRTEQEVTQACDLVGTLRLVRVSVIFAQLELAARDAAQLLGKQVELVCEGGDIRVEANILSVARDALLHLIRNAVDHGIEPLAQRGARGKNAAGRVRITAERRGRRVAFLCADDGGGIDIEAVRSAALQSGAVPPEELLALGSEGALKLIFRPGISTSRAVTEVSGRGIGLDVVRETAARLGGEVSVSSVRGEGCTIGLTVPISLSSLSALVVVVDTMQVLLPLSGVRGAQRLSTTDVIQHPDGESILYEGRAIPFFPLAPILGMRPSRHARWSAIIAQTGSEIFALGADRIDGTIDVVVKPLPPAAGSLPLVSGAALDVQGDPLLVLDLRGVLTALRGTRGLIPGTDAPAPPRPRILVIDDSLTTRTLEQSVLEVAGYEVDLASSGEEGLTMARAGHYGLFIVDIEMPGMNGLEFTSLTRADPVLRRVPVILVTSLASAEHRRRGQQSGAAAYIVKSEFDQVRFLETIAELLRGS